MAEIALGGIRAGVGRSRSRSRKRVCPHSLTLSTVTAGIERLVCETCGHLSVGYVSDYCAPVDRARFPHFADELYAAKEHNRAESPTPSSPKMAASRPSLSDTASEQLTVAEIIEELALT